MNIQSQSTGVILVLTSLPDQQSAEALARHLIAAKLAACVNILAPCTSIYHWQGKTESAIEVPLLIKTSQTSYTALEQTIRQRHPYELPEIIHVPVTGGLPAYMDWIIQQTSH
jgi:periplasmic divalent cation tolerance protein